ncbi:MAG TPA: 6-pyruvoyl-tetrahydropterin synthase-related protein, partial [Phototrophicaceae bacterium]|nr:6-pyruvoyl-tetrahydropterin synthase-related protein [Phototrophicaceae bacterium]
MEQHTLRAIQSVTSDAPTEDLPLWMRQARRRTDWGVILVVLLSLCISWSFLTRSGINLNSASLNHGFMAADIADGLREGHLYPRWSPHAFGGYGAPIPDYYPPGAAYTVALAEVLFTNDTETALRLIYALAPLLAGSMVYAFVSRRTGAPEGMLAALLYVFSPYFGLVAPHILGDLPGVLVLVLIPALLRSVNRLLMVNQPTDFVWIALATAALLLTRPSGLLAGIALSLILILLHLMDRKRWWRVLLVTIAMVIGVTMAAMYWLPALLELNAVHWIPPDFPAISHILTLSDFLAPLRQIDPGELAPTAQFTPGWVVLGFALVGLIGATTHHHAYRHQLAFLVAAIALIAGTVLFAPQITELTGII